MKIGVVGLWHLGCVTAACLAEAGYEVVAYDPNVELISQLQQRKTPIFEPGLDALLATGREAQHLIFTTDKTALAKAEIVWVAFDTPVDDHDVADVSFVMNAVIDIFAYLNDHATVLISSQLPVGTTRKLQNICQQQFPLKKIRFAYSPENLRLGKALAVFSQPDRIVVGIDDETTKPVIQNLLHAFSDNIVWMSIESAEMTKHAINAFLTTSVVFINELATICERVGADAREVERGLKTEERIGPKAYLRPGAAIGGGTLARDVNFLIEIAKATQVNTPLFSALLDSNQAHKQWSCQRIVEVLKNVGDKTIAILGLTYKADTDTLRRSTAVEIGEWFNQQGAKVVAYDPAVKQLPIALTDIIDLKSDVEEALAGADAVVVATEWQEFTTLTPEQILRHVRQPIVMDASGFLARYLGSDERIRYFTVGSQA